MPFQGVQCIRFKWSFSSFLIQFVCMVLLCVTWSFMFIRFADLFTAKSIWQNFLQHECCPENCNVLEIFSELE